MTHPNFVQSLNYFSWLWGQATLSGWMYLALGGALFAGWVAGEKNRRAFACMALPIMTVLPCVLATVGWSVSNERERLASWVPPATLACLIAWVAVLVMTLLAAPRRGGPVLLCALLSIPCLLLSAAIASMSGSGDWI